MKPAHLAGAVRTRCARASYGCIDSRMTAAYATAYTVRAALSRSPFAFRCAASAPPRACGATKARNPSREPPPSRCARALGGTGWLAGWTPASLLVFRQRRGATPDPAAGGCARSTGRGHYVPLNTAPRCARTRLLRSRGFGLARQGSLRSPCPSIPHPAPDFASLRRQSLRSGAPERGRLGSAPGVLRPPGPPCAQALGIQSLRSLMSSCPSLVSRGLRPHELTGAGAPCHVRPLAAVALGIGGLNARRPPLAACTFLRSRPPRLRPWRAQGLRQDARSLRSGLCLAPQCWSCLRLTPVSPYGDPVVCARTPALRLPSAASLGGPTPTHPQWRE